MSKGLFITFEGTDGCGKSTQLQLLSEYLKQQGFDVVLTREPGGTQISEKIRDIILDPNNKEESEVTEALLYAASRAQHVAEKIKPALESGKIVLCDRFMDSSIAYQAYARGLGEDVIAINMFAIQGCSPDVTFFLDLDPRIGQERQVARGKLDRLEQEGLAFQEKVYAGYKELINKYPDRFKVVNANREIRDIQSDIVCLIKNLLKQ
ncbi:MAG: dTMP kinase [Bacillota bacterium]|nr:dTMP kinase [Bacillota bacterium]